MVGGVRRCMWQGCEVIECNGVVVDQGGWGVLDQHTSAAPTHAHADFCRLDTDHKGTCGLSSVVTYGGGPHLTSSDVWQLKDAPEPPVLFWRCKHYPIATHNWHEGLVRCRFGCDAEPTWDSNGMRT
jgi:hypothetical protein